MGGAGRGALHGVSVPNKHRADVPASVVEPVNARRGEELVAAPTGEDGADRAALRASEARYQQALLEVHAALNRSEALYRVTRSLVAAETGVAVLQRVADAIAEAFGTDRVNLFALDVDQRLVPAIIVAVACRSAFFARLRRADGWARRLGPARAESHDLSGRCSGSAGDPAGA